MSRRSFLQHNPNQNYGARYQVRWAASAARQEGRGSLCRPGAGRRSPPLPPCLAIHAFPMHLRAYMQVFDLTSQGPAPFVTLSSFYPHVSRLVPSLRSFGRCPLWGPSGCTGGWGHTLNSRLPPTLLQGNIAIPGKPAGTVGQSVEGIWQVLGSAGTEMPPTISSPGCPAPGCVAVYAGHLPVHAPPSYRPQHCFVPLFQAAKKHNDSQRSH